MTRKDYNNAVALIKALDKRFEFRKPSDRKQVIDVLVMFFADDNPKFDRDRFMKAVENG